MKRLHLVSGSKSEAAPTPPPASLQAEGPPGLHLSGEHDEGGIEQDQVEIDHRLQMPRTGGGAAKHEEEKQMSPPLPPEAPTSAGPDPGLAPGKVSEMEGCCSQSPCVMAGEQGAPGCKGKGEVQGRLTGR